MLHYHSFFFCPVHWFQFSEREELVSCFRTVDIPCKYSVLYRSISCWYRPPLPQYMYIDRPGRNTRPFKNFMILMKEHPGLGKTYLILQGLQPAAVLKYSGLFLTLMGSMSGVCSTFIGLWIMLARVIKPVCMVCVHMQVCLLACAHMCMVYSFTHTFTQVMNQG